jgi:hypothetical protein
MRKSYLALIFTAAALIIHPAFAANDDESKPCAAIVKSCLDAGYTRDGGTGKTFWKDCMKPVILGQTVQGVSVDANTVKMCRADKIAQLKKDLQEFQKAFSSSK